MKKGGTRELPVWKAEAEQGEDEDERPHDVSWARVGPGVKRN